MVVLLDFFNENLSTITGFKQYNYASNWLIPVELIARKTRRNHGRNISWQKAGYHIIRHPKTGEVPDFKIRKNSFEKNYMLTPEDANT